MSEVRSEPSVKQPPRALMRELLALVRELADTSVAYNKKDAERMLHEAIKRAKL